MKITFTSIIVCFCLLMSSKCYPQQERQTKSKLVPVEVQMPEELPADSPNFLHVGVEKDGKYFYYFGGQQKRTPVELTALDSIVRKHKQIKDAVFVVQPCGEHANIGSLLDRLEDLSVKRFSLNQRPCD